MIPGDCAVYKTTPDGGVVTLYFSPGIPALSGRTPEEYRREVAVSALDAVMADDRENLRSFFRLAGRDHECYYRLWNRDRSKGFAWMHIKGRRLGELDGCPVTLVIFLNSSQESELYQSLLDHANSKIMVVDRASRKILYANTAMLDGADINYADTKCYEFRSKNTDRCADCLINRLKGPGEVCEQDYEDESDGSCEHVAAEFINWCGREACVLYVDDVTSRKQAGLRYENALRDLLSASPHTLTAFRLDLSRNICGHAYGTSSCVKKKLQSDTVDGLFENAVLLIEDEESRAVYRSKFSRRLLIDAFNRGETRVTYSFRRLCENDEIRWVTLYVNMMQNPRTGDIEAVAYSLDANDTKREETIIQRIASMEYDYIAAVDADSGCITYRRLGSGARATLIFETADYEEDLSRSLSVSMTPEEAEETARLASLDNIITQLDKSGFYSFVCVQRDENGEIYRKKLSHCWLDDFKKEILIIKSDVTEVYRQEQEQMKKLQEALLAAKQANEMKSEFLSNVSHDMRTPLNGVIGYTDLAIASASESDIRSYLVKIRQSGEVLLQLINDTLDLSKIETGAVTLKLEPVDCRSFIRRVVTSVRPSMNEKQIKFTLDDELATRGCCRADALRLQEIILNLLSNAVKFTPRGGNVEFAAVCVDQGEKRVTEKFVVKDSGVGISEAFLPRIFEPFSQERTAATADVGGSGLGLSIVKRLVEMMGGRIEVKSKLGSGSEFTVYLSFERADAAAEPQAAEPQADLSGKKVLLCEDNPINTEIARAVLEARGLEVVCAADGRRGLETFAASAPGTFDAVLMDIRMPVMKGYEAAARIRALNRPDARTVPIIAMTADAYEDDVKRCLDSGMNVHIAKPIDPPRLFAELARLCK